MAEVELKHTDESTTSVALLSLHLLVYEPEDVLSE